MLDCANRQQLLPSNNYRNNQDNQSGYATMACEQQHTTHNNKHQSQQLPPQVRLAGSSTALVKSWLVVVLGRVPDLQLDLIGAHKVAVGWGRANNGGAVRVHEQC